MPNFILESRLYTSKNQEGHLDNKFYAANKLYSNMVTYANKLIETVTNDPDYKATLEAYHNAKDEKVKKDLGKQLNQIRDSYGLMKSGLEKYCNVQRKESLHGYVDANTAQKVAFRIWRAVCSCLFGKGKKLHYKKINDLHSIEGKDNKAGIKFDKKLNAVKFDSMVLPIKVRKTDKYKQEALAHDICYCRIIRKPHKNKMAYYVQLVMDGIPPEKANRKLGVGRSGLDEGPSTIANVSDSGVIFEPLAPITIKRIRNAIVETQRSMDRSKRMTNKSCYEKNGTIKNGARFVYSNNYKKLRQQLKYLYRLKTCYLTEYQNRLAKKIMSTGDDFAIETIDFTSWAKRSKKPTEKSEKTKTVEKPNGEKQTVRLNKKKKMLGASVTNNSPAYVVNRLDQMLGYYGKSITFLNTQKQKLSQYRHDTGECVKMTLSKREKVVDGHKVQRDCYSAFLACNYKDVDSVDRQRCFDTFDKFVENQNIAIRNLKLRGDSYPACMSIK